MDPAAKQATRERIAALREAGTTILLTTHELGDVERLADRVAVLDRGRIVASGTPAELTGAGAPRIRLRLDRTLHVDDAEALAAVIGGGASVTTGGPGAQYEVRGLATPPDPPLVAAIAAWCAGRGLLLTELRVGAASLEERYLELVGDSGLSQDGSGRSAEAAASPAQPGVG
jgi:ABC-2 type transport system ATP-binding protein